MDAKDRNFLARADLVTANYRQRIAELQKTIAQEYIAHLFDDGLPLLEVLEKMYRLDKLKTEQAAHTQRVTELRDQQRAAAEINRLCADANKLAGTDGANFSTKAGKVFKEEPPDAEKRL